MPDTGEEDNKEWLATETTDLKLISDYTGLNFNECLDLDCFTYKLLLKDAFIYQMRQTEQGQEYLENCWILNQTNPDKESLREKFK